MTSPPRRPTLYRIVEYRQNMEVAWRPLEEKALLVEPRTAVMRTLSEVGARVWQLLEEWRGLDEMASAIEAEFDAPEEVIRADLATFLTELTRRGLVETRPE